MLRSVFSFLRACSLILILSSDERKELLEFVG